MPTLRLTQETVGENEYEVRLRLKGDGTAPAEARARFSFALTDQDYEDIRWYLEDYLQWPLDPAPTIAARVEGRLVAIGEALFDAIFRANEAARDIWAPVRQQLADTRIEIVTEVEEATSLPWELLRDPMLGVALALRARAFVRAQPEVVQRARPPQAQEGEPIRILLAICRPKGREDVPFRSVATRLLRGLNEEARQQVQLDVLRPPTFEQLARVLRAAKAEGRPYHVLHFDGHGTYADVATLEKLRELLSRLSAVALAGKRTGKHGYLLFEKPGQEENTELVDGTTLGNLLAETEVPVLVLNACRSAHAEPEATPDDAETTAAPEGTERAYGSLAQEVMDRGVAGVVTMRYNLFVVTATRFVADLYGALVRGQTLGQAVTLGRKQLATDPTRELAFTPIDLQDWPVPVVDEATPIHLFPELPDAPEFTLDLPFGATYSSSPVPRPPSLTTANYRPNPTSASSGETRRSWPWIAPLTRSRSCCSTRGRAAARRPRRRSSPAGTT